MLLLLGHPSNSNFLGGSISSRYLSTDFTVSEILSFHSNYLWILIQQPQPWIYLFIFLINFSTVVNEGTQREIQWLKKRGKKIKTCHHCILLGCIYTHQVQQMIVKIYIWCQIAFSLNVQPSQQCYHNTEQQSFTSILSFVSK